MKSKLEKIRAKAIASGEPCVILNLNSVAPLYVVRVWWQGCEKHSGFVEALNVGLEPMPEVQQ